MICIIIPVFNEQSRLEKNIEEIFSFIKSKKENFEVIFVNDGSKDKTLNLLQEIKKKFPIKILNHKINMGKGAAIKTGVDNSKGDLILFTDIDLSVPIEFLNVYLNNLTEDIDIIIGTRALKGAKIEVRQSWLRETLGEYFTLLSNVILGVRISDFTCGFKLFRRQAAQKIFSRQIVRRWAFDAETMYLAKKYHFNIKETPVVWRHKEGSKVRIPRDLIESLISLFQIRLNDLMKKYD